MATTSEERIRLFFSKITVSSIKQCHEKALSLTTGPLTPVPLQGQHSYTLYTTPSQNTIVQFLLASSFIELNTHSLAEKVYGDLVPKVSFEGEMGEDEEDGREAVCVYLMEKVPGVSLQEVFPGSEGHLAGDEMSVNRRKLLASLASFIARGWKSPQSINESRRKELSIKYREDLRTLLRSLDSRFIPIIEACLSSLDDIMALPFALQHPDLNASNIFIDPSTYQITGALGWSGAKIRPFGMNLHQVESLLARWDEDSEVALARFQKEDEEVFWETLMQEADGMDGMTIEVLKVVRTLRVLMDRGFDRSGDGERIMVDVGDARRGNGVWWLGKLLKEKAAMP